MEKYILCGRIVLACGLLYALGRCFSTSDFQNHTCSSIIQATQKNKYSSAKLYIPLQKNLLLWKNYPISCVYDINFVSGLTGIGISIAKYDPGDPSVKLTCIDRIITIRFFLYKNGRTVKELDCIETGEWIITWPWKKIVMEIQLDITNNVLKQDLKKAAVELEVQPRYSYRRMRYKPYRKKIILSRNPLIRTVPDEPSPLCLEKYYYNVVYYANNLSSIPQNTDTARFYLAGKSVCLRTYYYGLFNAMNSTCPWEVQLSVKGKLIMMLECEIIHNYWCLPESWFEEENELLEMKFKQRVNNLYGKYTITVRANLSVTDSCPLTTTSDPYWNTESSDHTTHDIDKSRTIGITVSVVGVTGLFFFFACCAGCGNVRTQTTQPNSGTNTSQHDRLAENTFAGADTGEAARNSTSRSLNTIGNPTTRDVASTNYYVRSPNNGHSNSTVPPPSLFNNTAPPNDVDNESLPLVPPPSYEDALRMIQKPGGTYTDETYETDV